MASGKFVINNRKYKDNSFISFISALLVFLAFLLLIHLLLILQERTKDRHGEEMGQTDQLRGHKPDTSEVTTRRSEDDELEVTTSSANSSLHHENSSPSNTNNVYTETDNGTIVTKDDVHQGNKTADYSTEMPTFSTNADGYEENTTIIKSTNADDGTDYSTFETSTFSSSDDGYEENITAITPITEDDSSPVSSITDVSTVSDSEANDDGMGMDASRKLNDHKRTAAKMLYMMKHDEEPCNDFYNFACGGNDINKQSLRYEKIQEILSLAKNAKSKPMQVFHKFYRSCMSRRKNNEFKYFDILEMLSPNMSDTVDSEMTTLIYELLVTQSMPFFDIGLRISNSTNFQIEITLSGSNSLKNSIPGWSILEEIKIECEKEQIRKVSHNYYNMDEIYVETKNCSIEAIQRYVKQFTSEMDKISDRLQDPSYRVNSSIQAALIDLFKNIFQELEIDSLYERQVELSALADDMELDFGLDWRKLLNLFDDGIDDSTKISMKFHYHLKTIFKNFKESKDDLFDILQLWKRIQLYKNIMAVPEGDDVSHCLNLATQLMPDVANLLFSETDTEQQNEKEKLIDNLFETMKSRFGDSFWDFSTEMDNMTINILQQKLNEIKLLKSSPFAVDTLEDIYKEITIEEESYDKNVMVLLENYRRRIISLNNATVTPEILGSYFLSPQDSKPKNFKPSNFILYQPEFLTTFDGKAPFYIALAKTGFRLALELTQYFEKVDDSNNLPDEYNTIRDTFVDNANELLRKLTINGTYSLDGKRHVIYTRKIRLANSLLRDAAAIRLTSDWMKSMESNEDLIWVNSTYTNEQIFFIMAAQEHCKPMTMYDITKAFLDERTMPISMRINSMMKNSYFFEKTFNCLNVMHGKIGEFPYPKKFESSTDS